MLSLPSNMGLPLSWVVCFPGQNRLNSSIYCRNNRSKCLLSAMFRALGRGFYLATAFEQVRIPLAVNLEHVTTKPAILVVRASTDLPEWDEDRNAGPFWEQIMAHVNQFPLPDA